MVQNPCIDFAVRLVYRSETCVFTAVSFVQERFRGRKREGTTGRAMAFVAGGTYDRKVTNIRSGGRLNPNGRGATLRRNQDTPPPLRMYISRYAAG